MTKVADISVKLAASTEGSNAFSGGPHWSGAMEKVFSLTNGTTAGKFDLVYMAERTVNASTNDDIDLAGSLTDPLGATITAAELVGIMIVNGPKDPTAAANVSDLTIGNGGVNSFVGFFGAAAHTLGPIKPGGVFFLAASNAAGIGTVTAGTGDILRIANGAGGTAKYQIGILARTA